MNNEKRKEEIKKEQQELILTCAKIKKKLKKYYNSLSNLSYIDYEDEKNNKKTEYDILYEKLIKLYEKYNKLEEELFMLEDPIIFSDEIELREMNDRKYIICLRNTETKIGEIEYRGYHIDYFGDIGYHINPKYRGHNYAYKALVLLSNLLKEQGIDDFYISVYKQNIASIKTIEKYGSNVLDTTDNVIIYRAPTRLIEKNNIKTS